MPTKLPARPAVLAQLRRRLLSSTALTPEWHGRGSSGRYDMAMGGLTEHHLPFAGADEVVIRLKAQSGVPLWGE